MSDSFEETPQKHEGDVDTSVDESNPGRGANDHHVEDSSAAHSPGSPSGDAAGVSAAAAAPGVSDHGRSSGADDAGRSHAASAAPVAAASGRPAAVSTLHQSSTRSAADRSGSPNRSNAGSRADSAHLPPIGGSVRRTHQPLVASVSYPARQEGLTVADFLDPSKPLVKSTAPLTKPKGPSFVEEETAEVRKQHHAEVRMQSAIVSSQIVAQRNNERKYLKAQYEFEREKKIAERAIYHKERTMQWSHRLASNPLSVDLVADNERIEEEAYVREREERHRQHVAERRKQRIKRAIIVKALAEVPLLEKARKEKRELVEGEKREKALRDVQRVEAIQARKILDQELMSKERQAKLDQRILGNTH